MISGFRDEKRTFTTSLCILLTALTLVLGGCSSKKVHAPQNTTPEAIDLPYVDLQPGWRLRVVTPTLKSGGFQLRSLNTPADGDFSHLSAGPDFLGYEIAYYAVTAEGDGLRVDFRSAKLMRDGKASRQQRPAVKLFGFPRSVRYLRFVYLIRVSAADHNMAVIAANDPDSLKDLTRRVLAHPEEACNNEADNFCSWVPAGISVQPEARRVVDGVKQWVAVP